VWLSDRPGFNAGFRFLYGLVAPLDAGAEVLFQGIASWFPGVGTTTALPMIGRSRGIIQGQGESAADYATRLIAWLDTWPNAGWEQRSAMAVHQFLAGHPRVVVVNRSGLWTEVVDGVITQRQVAWDWDSVSHPVRSDPDLPWWSDLWMIVYPTPWAIRPSGLEDLTGDDGFGIGHLATHEEGDAVKGLLAQWKSAHSRWRAVIWTSDPDRFNPDDPPSMPDGTWGAWGMYDGGSYVPSGRDLTTCRYWEPR
jgi:hypothetical protein